jgi:nanoRNase/pAp phosphatase (c-di-AMP/oligoRNAs hydrolase)
MWNELISRLKDCNKVIIVHSNADVDAIGSAYALSKCFGGDIFAPCNIDRVSKLVTEKLNIRVMEKCDISEYERVVVVDTSSPDQINAAGVLIPEDSIIIDHHIPTGKWEGMEFYCNNTKVSCCEIVLEILDEYGFEMTDDVAMALLGGMLTDSGYFQYANPALLQAFAELQERSGIPMDKAMELTRTVMNMSERTAVMKTISGCKFERIGDMIVAVAEGSSYEASSCKAILAAGADVSFVCTQRNDEFRLSGRATQEMIRRGIHLGEIMGELSNETDSDGGGHGGAAGITGVGDAEAMLHMCLMKTMDEFRRIKASMSSDGPPL